MGRAYLMSIVAHGTAYPERALAPSEICGYCPCNNVRIGLHADREQRRVQAHTYKDAQHPLLFYHRFVISLRSAIKGFLTLLQ
jgi:hypothetical protein